MNKFILGLICFLVILETKESLGMYINFQMKGAEEQAIEPISAELNAVSNF